MEIVMKDQRLNLSFKWIAASIVAAIAGLILFVVASTKSADSASHSKGSSNSDERSNPQLISENQTHSRAPDAERLRSLQDNLKQASASTRQAAQFALASYYAESDPEGGVEWIQSLDKSRNIHPLLGLFARVLARARPDSWQRFLDSFPDPKEKETFLLGAVRGIGFNDAKSAVSQLNSRLSSIQDPDNFRLRALQGIAQSNAIGLANVLDLSKKSDAKALFNTAIFDDQRNAFVALQKVTDPATQGDCMHAYLRGCGSEKLMEFSRLLIESNMSSVTKSEGLASATEVMTMEGDFASASKLALKIPDPALKAQMIAKIKNQANSLGPAGSQRIQKLLSE